MHSMFLFVALYFGLIMSVDTTRTRRHTDTGTTDTSTHSILNPKYINRFSILNSYKLMFCLIEKVANTGFSRLFKAVDTRRSGAVKLKRGRHPQTTYLWHNPAVYNLSVLNLEHMLQDESWYKVVFYREPLSRFLSAFKSKCEHLDIDDPKAVCKDGFGEDAASFHRATAILFQSDIIDEPHFSQQVHFCGGLNSSLVHYQAVYELSPLTSRSNIMKVLQHVGISTIGSGLSPVGSVSKLLQNEFPLVNKIEDFRVKPSKHVLRKSRPTIFSSFKWHLSNVVSHVAGHQTNSSTLSNLLKYYSHPCYVHAVVGFYEPDYRLFNISPPSWAMAMLKESPRESCAEFFKAARTV